ncbi:MAG: hypothetical protein GY711_07055 [bacterium]|nr:hypothetical protein [bacterium]
MNGWAGRLDLSEASYLAALRGIASVEVLETPGELWVRGPQADAESDPRLLVVPWRSRYRIIDTGEIVPAGRRVPCGSLPTGAWSPLVREVRPVPQIASLSGRIGAAVTLRIAASTDVREGTCLSLPFASFSRWAELAPAVRLERLEFALSSGGRALVRGEPLPPLPGELYYEWGRVLLPCGWACSPAVDPVVLEAVLCLQAGELARLRPSGSFERIPTSAFVRARRSAVRLSAGELER